MSNTSKGLEKVETLTIKEDRETKGRYARHNGLIHLDGNLKKARVCLMKPHSNLLKAFSRSILTAMKPFLLFEVDMIWKISWAMIMSRMKLA